MSKEVYKSKIESLIQTKDACNNHLAVLLSRSCLGYSTQEALNTLQPTYRIQKSGSQENFTATYEVAHLKIVYHISSAYIPYMDAEITVSRYVQLIKIQENQLIDALSGFIPIQAKDLKAYKKRITADFISITAELATYFEQEN